MIFQPNRYYRHVGTGEVMHTLRIIDTDSYGSCLIAETTGSANLIPVGLTEGHSVNWIEVGKAEWDAKWPITERA